MSNPIPRRVPTGTATPPRKAPGENSPNRPLSSATTPTSTGQGLGRSPSLRQSRPVRKPGSRMSTSLVSTDLDIDQDEDAKAANTQLIADLKEQVSRAEQASEQYRKQLEVMQQRLDDVATEQTTSEERDFQRQTEIDHLRVEIKDAMRQRRELELSHDSEKRLLLQERERQATKETDLQTVIKRLNETLRSRGLEKSNSSRNISASNPQIEDDLDLDSQNNTEPQSQEFIRALQEKDNTIETLKFELAEIHLKIAEQEHMGDGQLQNLEKEILETKMLNARLVEENESFQMLLSEKTLKGDFVPEHHHEDSSGLSTLAEELESAGDDSEIHTEAYRRLEAEVKTLRDGNKALTLYIDKIIGRLLQHEGFEHIILDKDTPPVPPKAAVEKALPPPPAPTTSQEVPPTVASAAAGFLQRARSVVSRPGPKTRPISHAAAAPTANENPETAPSIPLSRGHRRARSDQAENDLGAAQVIQQMNRGSPMRTVSGGPGSPGIGPFSPQFGPTKAAFPATSTNPSQQSSNSRTMSGSGGRGSSSNSITSEHSIERDSTGALSAQGSTANNPNIPGAVMKQNQLRPLRLVQEQSSLEEEQKRANRGSWMGWFNRSTVEAQNE